MNRLVKNYIMSTQDVANRLVEYCRTGQFETAYKELYSSNVVSIEETGRPNERCEGFEAVMEKSAFFEKMTKEIHSMEVSDPIVAGNHFSMALKMNRTDIEGNKMQMDEICVYQVTDGKIVKEQFFYPMG
jgi:hypothetical protein